MRTSKGKIIPLGISILWILAMSIFLISSDVYASAIQNQPSEKIFAAACATCHGSDGLGGVTWVKSSPWDRRHAPRIAGMGPGFIKKVVRAGSNHGSMPAFGPEEITNKELNLLAKWLKKNPNGVPAPALPMGTPVRLDILDADPWYTDDHDILPRDDDFTKPGGTDHQARLLLASDEYLKVYNTGRTWHTFTDGPNHKDSGFIGYAGNYNISPGDLGDMGYYYAQQNGVDLTPGCYRYYCKMHPYMQVEVCTAGSIGAQVVDNPPFGGPAGPEDPLGLTRAHKNPRGLPPTTGLGEVWVDVQSQEERGEDTESVDPSNNKSVIGLDGTLQVIDATTWVASLPTDLMNIGNNPHNSWPGDTDYDGNYEILTTSWHDNIVTLVDGPGRKVLGEGRSGASNAHAMVTPGGNKEKFYVTHMGGRALQAIDTAYLMLGLNPNGLNQVIRGKRATGPHGLWICVDPSNGNNYVLTADTFSNTATVWDLQKRKAASTGSGGGAPLAPTFMPGFEDPTVSSDITGCARGFTNNALTTDVSVYRIFGKGRKIARLSQWNAGGDQFNATGDDPVKDPGGASVVNIQGNIRLRNIGSADQALSPIPGVTETITQIRWAHLPIQTPVSPVATSHGQYMVTANKASFNVSITRINATTGLPEALYTIPAGLGAHGVTYGPKSMCDMDKNGSDETAFDDTATTCYYAYVTNTFEDYVSVYDLDKMEEFGGANALIDPDAICEPGVLGETCAGMGAAGSALIAETAYIEGGAVEAVINLDPVVAGTCDVIEIDWNNGVACGVAGDACGDGVSAITGGFTNGLGSCLANVPGGIAVGGYDICLRSLVAGAGPLDVLDCGIGAMTAGVGTLGVGAVFVSNVPIGVLCPDCRDGVHVGDIPLIPTTGEPLAAGAIALATDITNDFGLPGASDGATSKYTYLKEEVWVDTDTVACAVDTIFIGTLLPPFGPGPMPAGTINDCAELPSSAYGGTTGEIVSGGSLNLRVLLDLDLGINTGGQGIVVAPAAPPWP